MGEAAAAHEENEETEAPKKKTRRSKQAHGGIRARAGVRGRSAEVMTAPSGGSPPPSSHVALVALNPNDGL